jgi:A/G-specific adenine glycosylase
MNRETLDPTAVRGMRAALLAHYDAQARKLPWRGVDDPYQILVSEIMLQQTRVKTVKGYYETWLDRFPTLDDLAAASEDEVLKSWEGLGYYRRARNLRKAAVEVRERFGGRLPGTLEELRSLPGVGAYTAGAVASIAFGAPVAAVDGNVRRVLSRIFDRAHPTDGWLTETAATLVDEARPGDWNQALMDLGATICTPKAARCDSCPLRPWCRAHAADTVTVRPARTRRAPVAQATFAVAVFYRADRVMLRRRPPNGLLAGMWAFPERSIERETGGPARRGIEEANGVARDLGLVVGVEHALPEIVHRFTHVQARYVPWALEVESAPPSESDDEVWIDPADPGGRALPVAQRRILDAWRSGATRESGST